MKQTNEISWWQWGTVCLVGVAAIASSELMRFSPKWEDGAVLTTTVFTTVIVLSKRLWSHLSFWAVLVGLPVIHLIVANVILSNISNGRIGIPAIPFITIAYAEAPILMVILFKIVSREGAK